MFTNAPDIEQAPVVQTRTVETQPQWRSPTTTVYQRPADTMATQSKGSMMATSGGASTTAGDASAGGEGGGSSGQQQDHSTLVRWATSINWGTQQLLLAFFAFVVMIISSKVCGSCTGLLGWQVSVGTISGIIAIISGLLALAGLLTGKTVQAAISVFQFLWWIAGVITLTYLGSFTTTLYANGYFGTWGAFIISTTSLILVSSSFEQKLDKGDTSVRKPIFLLGLASAVVMGASIGPCSPAEFCYSYNVYALIVSCASLVICLILLCVPHMLERKAMLAVAAFLLLWWIVGCAVLTLGDPFTVAGNGYFGCYAALLLSVYFIHFLNTRDT